MKRDDLIRALRRYARKKHIAFDLMKAPGQGSHYRIQVGDRVTTLRAGELSPFHVRRICQQIGIDPATL